MRITEILAEERVIPALAGSDRASALAEMATVLARPTRLPPKTIASALEQRERAGSTGIGAGIAIPHAKVPGLTSVHGCFARSVSGVEFRASDGNPVFLFITLLAPEGQAALHLKALARASRLLQERAFREEARAADEAELWRLIALRDQGLPP